MRRLVAATLILASVSSLASTTSTTATSKNDVDSRDLIVVESEMSFIEIGDRYDFFCFSIKIPRAGTRSGDLDFQFNYLSALATICQPASSKDAFFY